MSCLKGVNPKTFNKEPSSNNFSTIGCKTVSGGSFPLTHTDDIIAYII